MSRSSPNRRILILEDELPYLQMVVATCERAGFEVISARSVDEALALLTEMRTVDLEPIAIDAIWLDHFLPGKNGSELVKVLKQDKVWANIPTFLVTNAVETEITNWYIRSGIKQVYTKMNNLPKTVLADIDLFLQRFENNDQPNA